MKFGYTILYVDDVTASLDFYTRAFDLTVGYRDEAGQYGELDTGGTAIAFASHALMADLLPDGYRRALPGESPLGVEIGLFTPAVEATYARALALGATGLTPPRTTPWGQQVAFVRCPDGTLVEICTPTARETKA